MWKLLISILAMSDTGAISTNLAVSEYESRDDCFIAAKEMSGRTEQFVNNHKFVATIKAQCSGDNPPPPPPQAGPPPRRGPPW